MKQALLFLFLLTGTSAAETAPRPNILYFYVDDMGWGAIAPNGQAARKAASLPFVRTPNLDKLAARGVNFTRSYGCTVCSPARSSQQSGFHQGHTFADRNDPDNAKKAMRADDVLMGDVLSGAGYVTGYWGKWGYGGSKSQPDPVIENVQTLPTSHGYEFVLAELHHVRAHTFFQPTLWSAPAAPGAAGGLELVPNSMDAYAGNSAYPDYPANQNHPEYPATAYCDDMYAFAALDFVRAQAKNYHATGQPFFGLLAVQIPHAPFDEIGQLPEWDKEYQGDTQFSSLAGQSRQWAAMVTRIDAHFGNILAALDDPDGNGDRSDSVSNNTLVIFQSDNGGPGGKAYGELDTNGGLRDGKGSIYEGGIRIPTIMRWPGRITAKSALRAGTSNDLVIDVSDLLPTFCELAGVEPPLGLDGVSLAPVLTGKGERRPREFLIHEAGKGQSIIRGRDKLVRTKNGLELYDLDADPAEKNDIASSKPKLVRELEAFLLGERVAEPRGFANTYHRWTGASGASASDPGNWSDYVYENAGITYLTDDGPPRVSWIAVMENTAAAPATARADEDLEFLGLEIRGPSESATQELILGPGVDLTGRNEIRLSANSILTVDGGAVSSLRWIDVREGASLRGAGKVDATIYSEGNVTIESASVTGHRQRIEVSGDYRERPGSKLELRLSQSDIPESDRVRLRVRGKAVLAGELVVSVADGFAPRSGEVFTIVSADEIEGAFSNPGGAVVGEDGSRFNIEYSGNAVRLTVEKTVAHVVQPSQSGAGL